MDDSRDAKFLDKKGNFLSKENLYSIEGTNGEYNFVNYICVDPKAYFTSFSPDGEGDRVLSREDTSKLVSILNKESVS